MPQGFITVDDFITTKPLPGSGLPPVSAWLCARQGRRCRQAPEEFPRRIAAATVEAILAILALEALLSILIPPNLPTIG